MEQVEQASVRPLWRRIVDYPLVALLISVAIYICALALGIAIGKLFETMGQPERSIVRAVINIGVVLAAYKFIITRLGDHPRDDLRLDRDWARNLGLGLLAGFLIMAVAVGAAAAAGVYRIVGIGDSSTFVLELVGTAIMPAFMEELLFRGILQRWIEAFAGSWAGLILTSLLFGFAHYGNPNATILSCLWIAIEAGILLGGAYMLTGSLWLSMGMHAAWNFTQGEIFDVPVSGLDEHGLVQAQMSGPPLLTGGAFGLEASLFGLIPATAFGVWLVWLAVKRGKVVPPIWVRSRRAVTSVEASG